MVYKRGKIIKIENFTKTIQEAQEKERLDAELSAKQKFTEKDRKIKSFRKNLKIGDYADKGLIVEIKKPLANIQTQSELKWYRIDNLYPLE